MNIREKLSLIQSEMKAPKNLFNKFGGYPYRNAEGILEAFKPYITKYKVMLTISDDVKLIGERFYIVATATITDAEGEHESVSVSALAREDLAKKGMDSSQLTGSTSSYARKYALNGLFLLDDNKDADEPEYKAKEPTCINSEQLGKILAEIKRTGIDEAGICKSYNIKKLEEMQISQYENCIARFSKTPTKENRS